jgi:putative transcriptional regulator
MLQRRKAKSTETATKAMMPRPMTDKEIEAAAEEDEENPPWTDEDFARAKRVPPVKFVRRQLVLSQEAFAERYMIPLGTLRDWEQGVSEPDGAGKAYVRAIIGDPEGVARALRRDAAE